MRIVLTGSSSGIGRAIAERQLECGHEVWGLARSDQTALHQRYPGFRSTRCDVSRWPEVAQARTEIESRWTTIDALICCAGSQGAVGPALATDPESWMQTIQINLGGTFHCLRAFETLLRPSERRGKIVCFSGGGATKARPRFSAYGAAKTALVRVVETIAEEERERALDINAIAPGAIATAMTDEVLRLGADVAGNAEIEAAQATRSQGPEPLGNVLALVDWLLSQASDGVTGKLISAQWDPWRELAKLRSEAANDDWGTLRRVAPNLPGKA